MDQSAINFEILRIAKELVVNEYTDRRAQLHNQWLIESDHLWRTRRLRLAYPPIPPYPTEQDVVNRAKLLREFLLTEHQPKQPDPPPSDTIKPVPETTVESSLEETNIKSEEPSTELIGGWQTPEEEFEERRAKTFPAMLKSLWSRDDKK